MKGKGLFIACGGVVCVMASACLIGGDYSAFGGALIVAAVLLAVALLKRRRAPQTPAQAPVAAPHETAAAEPVPAAPAPAAVAHDLDGPSFGSWDVSIHGADGQDLRFDRAMFQNITIRSYDPAAGSAEILGTRGESYETTLDTCTCEDFQRRGLPCKHIYKLALARGYSPDAFYASRSDVVWYADGCRVYHSDPNCRGLRKRYSRRTTVALAEYQLLMLDAPVSGGAVKAAAGDMTVMASGSDAAFARLAPVLDAVAGKVYRIGSDIGLGSTVKIIHQLLAGVHIAVAAEAMALAARAGIPLETMYDVVTHAAGNSWMFENRMQHVLDGDYSPKSAVDIFVKDLGLVNDTARALTFPLPLATTALNMFTSASNAGFGREDDSAVIKIFNGITLPGHKQ